jgi:hypothetical protein
MPWTVGAHRRLFHGRARTGHGGSAFPPVVTPKAAAFSSHRGSAIGSRHDLRGIGKGFCAPEPDLQARPVRHRKRGLIEGRLTIVFAALAVSRWIKARTGQSPRGALSLLPLSGDCRAD